MASPTGPPLPTCGPLIRGTPASADVAAKRGGDGSASSRYREFWGAAVVCCGAVIRSDRQSRTGNFRQTEVVATGINWRARVLSTMGNHYLAPHCHMQMWIWDCKGKGCFST